MSAPRHSVGRAGRGRLGAVSGRGAARDPAGQASSPPDDGPLPGSVSSVLLLLGTDTITELLGEDKFTDLTQGRVLFLDTELTHGRMRGRQGVDIL